MQTKNINLNQNAVNEELLLEKMGQVDQIIFIGGAPPLPPRQVYAPISDYAAFYVSGPGSTPYKPVPPPRPLGGTGTGSRSSPLNLPGAAPPPLHTHSSKFPIEREVILRSAEKECKIPVLQEYRRKLDRSSVAPDAPRRQDAWVMETQNRQVQGVGNSGDVSRNAGPSRSGHQEPECGNPPVPLKQTFIYGNRSDCKYDDLPNGTNNDTGKESTKESKITSKSVTKTYHTLKDMISSRFKGKDSNDSESKSNDPEMGLNNVTEEMRKSLRERAEQEANNANANAPRDNIVRKTAGEQGIYGRPVTQQRPADAQYTRHLMQIQQMQNNSVQGQYQMQQMNSHMQQIAGQPPNQQSILSQQQFLQQHLIINQQQQHILGHGPSASSTPQHNLVQARSQELLNRQPMDTPPRPHSQIVHQMTTPDNVYYQPQYVSSGNQRRELVGRPLGNYQGDANQSNPNYSGIKQVIGNQIDSDNRSSDVRSPQQLEREILRQRGLADSRRTTSHPQLPHEDEEVDQSHNRTEPSTPDAINKIMQMRRGSHGNLLETMSKTPTSMDHEKDSDDGGFRSRMAAQGKSFDSRTSNSIVQQNIRSLENEMRHKNDSSSDVIKSDSIYGSMKTPGYNGIQQRQLESDETTNIHGKKINPGSAASSDYDKNGGPSSNIDSGRGSAAYSSGRRVGHDTSTESDPVPSTLARSTAGGVEQAASGTKNGHGGESEWVDIVESELRQILEPKLHGMSLGNGGQNGVGGPGSETTSSVTPPLPPLTPTQSTPDATPRNSARFKHQSLPYGNKPEYTAENRGAPSQRPGWQHAPKHRGNSSKKQDHSQQYKRHMFGLETDITSTTTRSLDLSSMLDGQSDSDVSTQDARAIRRQLQGLENMYCEVLKLLGVRKPANHGLGKYQPSDPRLSKRRYGSMSSLPSSSVSSRPVRDKRRNASEQRKKVSDIKGINKRFQRLESHVVTLARSVAHLSSEMRTQHLMIQEMENIRGEITSLRNQQRSQSMPRMDTSFCPATNTFGGMDASSLANPSRVKKLTKFFGDEPPLLRMFLKKLGYEKYAPLLEKERVGAAELPFLGEERLRALGVPLGPRLRILHEARLALPPSNTSHTTLCIV